MKPEDIRRLYRELDAATEAEARETQQEARTNPDTARALLKTIYSLSVEDRDTALLLRLFLEGMLMRHIEERAEQDDAYALACADLILGLMEQMKPPPRGKPGKAAKTA